MYIVLRIAVVLLWLFCGTSWALVVVLERGFNPIWQAGLFVLCSVALNQTLQKLLSFGVPHGSILGPLKFTFYLLNWKAIDDKLVPWLNPAGFF